jgi:hypothetical protein
MYALAWKNGYIVWKKQWYTFTWRVLLWIDLYITQKDQVFIVDVVVIDSMRKMMSLNVINWLAGAAVKFNVIAKISKYKGFYEGRHFIPMTMEVHNAPRRDMDRFIRECAHLFQNRQSKGHLSLFFCIQFSK